MNRRELVKANEDRVYGLYQEKALQHPEQGKIACYIVSNGEKHTEQQQNADTLFTAAVAEVATELGIALQPEPMNRHLFIGEHKYHINDIFKRNVMQHDTLLQMINAVFEASVSEVATKVGVALEPPPTAWKPKTEPKTEVTIFGWR